MANESDESPGVYGERARECDRTAKRAGSTVVHGFWLHGDRLAGWIVRGVLWKWKPPGAKEAPGGGVGPTGVQLGGDRRIGEVSSCSVRMVPERACGSAGEEGESAPRGVLSAPSRCTAVTWSDNLRKQANSLIHQSKNYVLKITYVCKVFYRNKRCVVII